MSRIHWIFAVCCGVAQGCGGADQSLPSNQTAAHEPRGETLTLGSPDPLASPNVLTYRNDISRTGAYLAETKLAPANVNTSTFGKLYERAVQGDIYAQPLYMRGVATPKGSKNLFFVATSTNDLYAFDADETSTDPYAGLIWHRSLNPWRPLVINLDKAHPGEICAETVGSVGVTSTPVIDPVTQTMYVTTRRSGGTVVASGGNLYQLHNDGNIWKYTGTPCTGTNCPGWQLYDNNPSTIQIASSFGEPGLFQLHRSGQVFASTGAPCGANGCLGWNQIDAFPGNVRIAAAGAGSAASVSLLHEDGSIFTWSGSGSSWNLEDNNPLTKQIVVASDSAGTQLYQLRRDGSIWWHNGTGVTGWTMMDSNPLSVQIAAAGHDLYQLHSDGSIWKSTGVACSGGTCPGWQMFDSNPGTTSIVTARINARGASSLYQLHTDGSIWRSNGTPCANGACPGWVMIDNNIQGAQIVADNQNDIVYQIHIDGSIWKWTGVPCNGNTCPGWQMLDNNWALNDGANYLHAVNITDGTERQAPTRIAATDPNNTNVRFDGRCQRQRPGLLLLNGIVYLGFATFSCDQGAPDGTPYHGWILGYRASDLTQVSVFDTSGDGGGAGVWQSGGGLVGAADGSIYFETGNDTTPHARLGDSFVKLQASASGALSEAGHYTLSNAATLRDGGQLSPAAAAMNKPIGDTDLGSGGPLLLPGGRLVGGGKQGRYYVFDSSSMQLAQDTAHDSDGFEGFQAFENTWHPAFTHTDYEMGELYGPNIHSAPIYWAATGYVYQMPEKDYLKGFFYDPNSHALSEFPVVTASGSWARPRDGMPGGFSSLSANGQSNGIVWTSLPQQDGQWVKVPGVLAAFDAVSLRQLWVDETAVSFAKFVPPMIADGRVYRATFTSDVHHGIVGKIVVYGVHGATNGMERVISDQPGELAIDAAYRNHGGPLGPLGHAISSEKSIGDAAGGRFRDFRSTPRKLGEAALHPVQGNAALRPPINGQWALNSAIYWTPRTGAHVVQGGILTLWRSLGAEKGALGYPISDELNAADATERVSHFEHGDIIWNPSTGAAVTMSRHQGRAASHRPVRSSRN